MGGIFQFNPFKRIFAPLAKKDDQFRIKVEKKSNRTVFTPQVKSGESRFNHWERIVYIYGKFYVMELDDPSGLSEEECRLHIQGYLEQRNLERNSSKVVVEYIPVEVTN